jgi:hypothetical protein
MIELIKIKGDIERVIEYKNGNKEVKYFKNTILTTGRRSLARSLANQIGESGFENYVIAMVFGQGGVSGTDTPKFVGSERTQLYSVVKSKPVIANVDGTQVIFTSVLSFEEFGPTHLQPINEAALKLANNDLYSMVTFPQLTKTESMQITWNWRISFI